MGNVAGLTFILPEIGEIANVFITPIVSEKYGISQALIIGLFTCIISFIACIFLYCHLKEIKKKKSHNKLMFSSPNSSK